MLTASSFSKPQKEPSECGSTYSNYFKPLQEGEWSDCAEVRRRLKWSTMLTAASLSKQQRERSECGLTYSNLFKPLQEGEWSDCAEVWISSNESNND